MALIKRAVQWDRLTGYMSTTPFAALASALIAGILTGRYSHDWWALYVCAACALAAITFIYPVYRHKGAKRLYDIYSRRNTVWLFILPSTFIVGFIALRIDSTPDISSAAPYARGIVEEYHSNTSGDVLTVSVKTFLDEHGKEVSTHPFTVNVYTDAALVSPGDIVVMRINPEPIEAGAENDEYKNLMYARGIDFASNTEGRKIIVTGQDNGLRYRALQWRNSLISFIETSRLNRETVAFLSAFLTGDKDALSPHTRNTFAAAGIAHILALSGLHVGLLALILGGLLRPLGLFFGKTPVYLLTAGGMILFAIFSGLGTSVLRATIMGTGVMLSLIMQRQRSAMNILCAAAFGILLFQPRALFDIGFQLSFVCTSGIVGVLRHILPTPEKKHFRLYRLYSWLALPCVIFMVSWPVSAYYFKELSLLFLPLNLIIIPLLPLFIILSLIYLTLHALGASPTWIADTIDWTYSLMTESAEWVATHHLSSVPIDLHWLVPCLYLLGFAFVCYWLVSRSRSAFATATLLIAASFCSVLFMPGNSVADGLTVRPCFDRCEIVEYRYGKSNVNQLPDGGLECLRLNGANVVWADKQINSYTSPRRFECKILLLGPYYEGSLTDALNIFNPEQLILHASMDTDQASRLYDDACKAGIPVHDLRLQGACRVYW